MTHRVLAPTLWLVLLCVPALADSVRRKDGTVLEGKILQVTDEAVLMHVDDAKAPLGWVFAKVPRTEVDSYSWPSREERDANVQKIESDREAREAREAAEIQARLDRARSLVAEYGARLTRVAGADPDAKIDLAEWLIRNDADAAAADGNFAALAEELYVEVGNGAVASSARARAERALPERGFTDTRSYGWVRLDEVWRAHGFELKGDRWITHEVAEADARCRELEAKLRAAENAAVDSVGGAAARSDAGLAQDELRRLQQESAELKRDLTGLQMDESYAAELLGVDTRIHKIDTLKLDGAGNIYGKGRVAWGVIVEAQRVDRALWNRFEDLRDLRRNAEKTLKENATRIDELKGEVGKLTDSAAEADRGATAAGVQVDRARREFDDARESRARAERRMAALLGPDGLPMPTPNEERRRAGR